MVVFALPFAGVSCNPNLKAPLSGYECALGTAPGADASPPLLILIGLAAFGLMAAILRAETKAYPNAIIGLVGVGIFTAAVFLDRPSSPGWFPVRVTREIGFWLAYLLYAILLVYNWRHHRRRG